MVNMEIKDKISYIQPPNFGYIHWKCSKRIFTSGEITSYMENSTCHELVEPPEPHSHATQVLNQ